MDEDIEDSYVRCGQIADAAIEIEKIIKDLLEEELQDEKVVKAFLKKCFGNQEDIGSMAEGMCLEMLTEKVTQLVRDLYLQEEISRINGDDYNCSNIGIKYFEMQIKQLMAHCVLVILLLNQRKLKRNCQT